MWAPGGVVNWHKWVCLRGHCNCLILLLLFFLSITKSHYAVSCFCVVWKANRIREVLPCGRALLNTGL